MICLLISLPTLIIWSDRAMHKIKGIFMMRRRLAAVILTAGLCFTTGCTAGGFYSLGRGNNGQNLCSSGPGAGICTPSYGGDVGVGACCSSGFEGPILVPPGDGGLLPTAPDIGGVPSPAGPNIIQPPAVEGTPRLVPTPQSNPSPYTPTFLRPLR